MATTQKALANGAATSSARVRVYQDDTVKKRGTEEVGLAVRCWYSEEEAHFPEVEADSLERPLKEGEIGVIYPASGDREILNESDLEVCDRAFQLGDVCKRSLTASLSAVIVGFSMELELEHALTGQRIQGRIPAKEVVNAIRINAGDHVIHGNWVGSVEEVFEEALVETEGSSDLVRVCDIGHSLSVGAVPNDLVTRNSLWTSVFNWEQGQRKKIVDVRQILVCVNWLAINQKLKPAEQEGLKRPMRFWTDLSKLTNLGVLGDRNFLSGDKVIFRDPAMIEKYGLHISKHGVEQLEVSVMNVVATHTKLEVLWQDSTTTTEDARDLVPYVNLDEHDVWGGDHVLWKGEDGQQKGAVVQSMDPVERTAVIKYYDLDEVETIPVLELDVQGPDPVSFGIHRGDTVLLSTEKTAFEAPTIGRIGESEDLPHPDDLREDMSRRGMAFAAHYQRATPQVMPRAAADAHEIDWFGTVVALERDGGVVVGLPDGRKILTSITKLTLLAREEGDDGWGDGDEAFTDLDGSEGGSVEAAWMTEEGVEAEKGDWDDDWEDVSETGNVRAVDIGKGEAEDTRAEASVNEKAGEVDVEMTELTSAETTSAPQPTNNKSTVNGDTSKGTAAAPSSGELPRHSGADMPSDDARWPLFEIREAAPADHAFIGETNDGAPAKPFYSRLQKEFRALQSSLPDSILVRAYEDRTDLLRAVIIGSEGTPYEDAPFLIDLRLKPSYPHEPPVAHFHSWTNGNGRVSPNLYEEGKICLSVLNTWSGEKSESWNPAKSSLLQVLVSILGLVLVRDPYYTEPAFERLSGTEEGRLNAAYYAERAYVLSRGFIRRALEHPVAGFEEELRFFYLGDGANSSGDAGRHKGRLERVLTRGRALMAASSSSEGPTEQVPEPSEQQEGVPRLSGGGAIILKRTLDRLEKIAINGRSS